MTDLKTQEKIKVASNADSVSCDGGGELGHPKTYYSFNGNNSVTCRYCNREFVKSS